MKAAAWLLVFVALFSAMFWFAVLEPSIECYRSSGTPVRGLLVIECIPHKIDRR